MSWTPRDGAITIADVCASMGHGIPKGAACLKCVEGLIRAGFIRERGSWYAALDKSLVSREVRDQIENEAAAALAKLDEKPLKPCQPCDSTVVDVREEDCKAVCPECRHGVPISPDRPKSHDYGNGTTSRCKATPIRELERRAMSGGR